MKSVILYLMLLITTCISRGADIPQSAIDYYANKYGHAHPDTVQIVQADFNGDGSSQFLMTFAKGDWSGPEAVWTVVQLKNGLWDEPKTFGFHGEISDFSAIAFDPNKASFVYLPAYKRNGIMTRWKKNWTFTYLEKNVLYTVYFWDPSQAGLTNESLKQLMDSKKITVIQKQVP